MIKTQMPARAYQRTNTYGAKMAFSGRYLLKNAVFAPQVFKSIA
jgi:hypothetical protein